MKTLVEMFICLTICFTTASLAGNGPIPAVPVSVVIHVVDPDGLPVSNAVVRIAFAVLDQRNAQVVETMTDEFGKATGEHLANDRIVARIEKEGYYRSSISYKLWEHGRQNNGRWEPWNPTLKTILYPRKTPNVVRKTMNTTYHLNKNLKYGYDLLDNRVVVLGEEAAHPDFLFWGIEEGNDADAGQMRSMVQKVVFEFPSRGDGFIRLRQNEESQFKFIYQAPLDGYESSVAYTISRYPHEKEMPLPEQGVEYLVFRISRKNEDTGEVDYYYGIITDILRQKEWDTQDVFFTIRYYINPTPGDRNIEYN